MKMSAISKRTPLISIITPYRDARKFLPCLVSTLKNQTYQYWECLLVDHASSDSGGTLAKTLTAGDHRFRNIRLTEKGSILSPAIPRNEALKQVHGSFLCFLDVDDLWHPEKLERQLAFHQKHQLDISVTAYARTRDGHKDWLTWRCPPPALEICRLLRSNAVPMLTVMVTSKLFQSPQWCESPLCFLPVRHEDYVMWLQLWGRYPELRYGCLPELLALHQRHGRNITSNRAIMIYWLYTVHLLQAPAPVAAWRALVGGCDRLLLALIEYIGVHQVPYDSNTLLQKKPLSILKF